MIVAHVHGIPIEEGVLQLVPAAAAIATAVAVAGRTSLDRLRRWATRRGNRGGES
jgi:hypothetical protein